MNHLNVFDQSPLPLGVDPRFELSAVGDWDNGGLLEIRFATKSIATIDLTVSEWSVLAMLMQAAKESLDSHSRQTDQISLGWQMLCTRISAKRWSGTRIINGT